MKFFQDLHFICCLMINSGYFLVLLQFLTHTHTLVPNWIVSFKLFHNSKKKKQFKYRHSFQIHKNVSLQWIYCYRNCTSDRLLEKSCNLYVQSGECHGAPIVYKSKFLILISKWKIKLNQKTTMATNNSRKRAPRWDITMELHMQYTFVETAFCR